MGRVTAGRYDLVIEQGATWRKVFDYQNPNGTIYPLTGWTGRMQIRRRHASADPLVTITPSIDGPAGRVTVALTAVQTAALPMGRSVYDLELVAPGGDVTRFIEGSVIVDPETTR